MRLRAGRTATPPSTAMVAAAYIGTVIGAGFATGQEVLQFFGFHGLRGLWGLALSTLLFMVYGWLVLELGHRLQARSHQEVVRTAGGPWLGTLIDWVITFFLAGAFATMAAGAGAIFAEQFRLPAVAGGLLMVAVTVGTVLLGIRGVVTAISAVVPLLLATVLVVSGFALFTAPVNWQWARPERAAVSPWPLSAVAYASYNLILAISILAPLGKLSQRSALRRGAFWGGLGLGLSAAAIQVALMTRVPRAAAFEIPMLFIAREIFDFFPLVYSAVLLAEIYTTAVGSLYGFVARLTPPEGTYFRTFTLVTGGLAFLASRIGFAELIATLYSAVGYAGVTLLVALTYWYLRGTKDT